MRFEVQGYNSKNKRAVEHLLPLVIDELKLNKSSKWVLVYLTRDFKQSGLTTPIPGVGGFFVTLKSNSRPKDLLISLCHEMMHVKQMASGLLVPTKGGNLWAKKFYKKDTPYLDRPWEIQAFQMQELVLRRVLEMDE